MPKGKSKEKKLVCPCCKGEPFNSGISRMVNRQIWIWGAMHKLSRNDLESGNYQWACDECLTLGKAVSANPALQTYCDVDPYLAYFDVQKQCEKCHCAYTFTKEEQHYWYEVLKFWVQSTPKQCLSCRKEVREEKTLNKELSELLKDKEKLTIQDMERLPEIYEQINKPDKSHYYRNVVDKLKKKRS